MRRCSTLRTCRRTGDEFAAWEAVFKRTDLQQGMGIKVLKSKKEYLCRVRILHELLCPSEDGPGLAPRPSSAPPVPAGTRRHVDLQSTAVARDKHSHTRCMRAYQ